jgi:hypothetical protein
MSLVTQDAHRLQGCSVGIGVAAALTVGATLASVCPTRPTGPSGRSVARELGPTTTRGRIL